MTLTKYWVLANNMHGSCGLVNPTATHAEPVYLAADVDHVVEELRDKLKLDYDLLADDLRREREYSAALKADLARVTEELEQIKGAKK